MTRSSSKPHVAVLLGGLSSEREVSLVSGNAVITALKSLGYQVTPIDMGRDIASKLIQTKPDVVFNALHGPYGEDGCVQGLLEIMQIPYTHSGVTASAICMDKIRSKEVFVSNNILCPKGKIIARNDNINTDPIPRPYVVKPIFEGSSIGVNVVFEKDNFSFVDYEWKYGDQVIIEEYIPGKEIQVAVVGDTPLGAIEIRPKGRFYDYEAKYTKGKAEHFMPAPISKDAYEEVLELAGRIHRIMGCRSVSRVDFRYDDRVQGKGGFYVLEVNTHPGFTPLSLVPEIAAHAGISFSELVEKLISEAKCDR